MRNWKEGKKDSKKRNETKKKIKNTRWGIAFCSEMYFLARTNELVKEGT
jgi:hypothetical protein